MEWDAEQEKQAEQAVKHNSVILLPDDKIGINITIVVRIIILIFS